VEIEVARAETVVNRRDDDPACQFSAPVTESSTFGKAPDAVSIASAVRE
jgi:hypothetical protein